VETKKGLREQLDELNEKINVIAGVKKKKGKVKAFKVPFNIKAQLKNVAKKKKVQVIYLQNNKNIKPTIGDIKEGMLIVEGKVYDGSSNFMWLWNGKIPTAIVPEWDLQPIHDKTLARQITAEELQSDAIQNKRLSDPQTIILRSMEHRESLVGKKLGSKAIIWIVIGGIIAAYILFAGGGQ